VTVRAGDAGLAVGVAAPGWAEKVPVGDRAALPPAERIASAWAALDRIDGVIDSLRPRGSVVSGRVSADHERYYALKELADAVGDTLNEYEDRLDGVKRARIEGSPPGSVSRKPRFARIKVARYAGPREGQGRHDPNQPFRSLTSAASMQEALRELFESAEPLPEDADLFDVENRLALLRLMASAPPDDRPVYLWIRGFPEGNVSSWAGTLGWYYTNAWASGLGVEVTWSKLDRDTRVEVRGVHARPLALTEAGTHLVLPKHGGPVPVRVDVLDAWPPRLADPYAFGPILRVYPEGQPVADVRTGLVSPLPDRPDFAETFRTFTLAALPRAT
jgi:hypothetical protein